DAAVRLDELLQMESARRVGVAAGRRGDNERVKVRAAGRTPQSRGARRRKAWFGASATMRGMLWRRMRPTTAHLFNLHLLESFLAVKQPVSFGRADFTLNLGQLWHLLPRAWIPFCCRTRPVEVLKGALLKILHQNDVRRGAQE